MMDFLNVRYRNLKEAVEVYPDFLVKRSTDIMIRGGVFYAAWDQELGLWTQDEFDVQRLVDKELFAFADEMRKETTLPVRVKSMVDFSTGSWSSFKLYLSKLADNYHQLDTRVTFSNTKSKKTDYVSRKLSYPLQKGASPAFDKLFNTLYDAKNRAKIMWAIGSLIDGASKDIQKFYVFFGDPGTGKSTALNLIQELFTGYWVSFEASSLTGSGNSFAASVFRENPLVAVNHDGDLSRIRDNSMLNGIVSHDPLSINVKYQTQFDLRLNTMLMIATNKPVAITDAKSGLIRRLIDIRPTGNKVPVREYDELVAQARFELGAIAHKCLATYNKMGKDYYNHYKPMDMIMRTDVFFNFLDEHYFEFKKENYITLKRAWKLYKEYCEGANIEYRLQLHRFRDELRNYWYEYHDIKRIDGIQYRSVFMRLDTSKFTTESTEEEEEIVVPEWLTLVPQESILDSVLGDSLAQAAGPKDTPEKYWADVTETLASVDSSELHYVIPPEDHIVIDFDLKDDDGNKSLDLNIAAAELFPPTYAEASRGGAGLHLHYNYDGDTSLLSRLYSPGIDVLVPKGNFSIRRKLSTCNTEAIATINSGLPLKEEKKIMVSKDKILSEKALRTLVMRNVYREIHANTKPSVDFIDTILREAVASGSTFDLSDLKPDVMNLAMNSSNNAEYCIKKVLALPFSNEPVSEENPQFLDGLMGAGDGRLVFFDIEVVPNLLLISWKYAGAENTVHRMHNPSPEEVGIFIEMNLIGFNCRKYDNHILYARFLGYNNKQLWQLSRSIIYDRDRSSMFREAYGISYTDVYDYSSKKQSLKKWQIELGIFHKEMDIDWDVPLSESEWDRLGEYCDNDVVSLEVVHDHLHSDFTARRIISEISGLTVNDSTLSQATRIVFGKERNPQRRFNYTDLSEMFPGYTYAKEFVTPEPLVDLLDDMNGVDPATAKKKKVSRKKVYRSRYRGEVVGEGGYVYGVPGTYTDVLYMDVASMHPASIELLNLFGPYTKRYTELKEVRMAIKYGRYEEARQMYGGVLAKYLDNPSDAKDLSFALKIIINIVYGLTAAKFQNKFRDPRNIDNIVAKRGALFMVDLKHALEERGCNAIHYKTDSVKIANGTKDDEEFVKAFGKKYGYSFGVEGVYESMALINDAVLIGKWKTDSVDPNEVWDAVGARFKHPYVYKKLFTQEPITIEDYTETRAVRAGSMYITMDEDGVDRRTFIGKVGRFIPIKDGHNAGRLLRVKEGKDYAVSGTKGTRWLPADIVIEQGLEDHIDITYFDKLVEDAIGKINAVGDINQLGWY